MLKKQNLKRDKLKGKGSMCDPVSFLASPELSPPYNTPCISHTIEKGIISASLIVTQVYLRASSFPVIQVVYKFGRLLARR